MKTTLRRPDRHARTLDYDTYLRIVELVEKHDNLQVSAPLTLFNPSSGNMVLGISGQAAFDYSIFQFGFSIVGTTVTIKAGELRRGKRDPVVCAETDVVITQDKQFTGLSFDGTTVTMLAPNVTESVFKSTDTEYRCWLHQFSLVGGSVSIYNIGHLGYIELDASYG